MNPKSDPQVQGKEPVAQIEVKPSDELHVHIEHIAVGRHERKENGCARRKVLVDLGDFQSIGIIFTENRIIAAINCRFQRAQRDSATEQDSEGREQVTLRQKEIDQTCHGIANRSESVFIPHYR